MKKLPRGIRNNNPGNIRWTGEKWKGRADPPHDGAFCRFETAPDGIRALARVLLTYHEDHGLRTIRDILGRWAPPAENDTPAYIRSVAFQTGRDARQQLDLTDHATMARLVRAIVLHENGLDPYTDAQIDKGLLMAGIEAPARPLARSRTVMGGTLAAIGTALGAAAEPLLNAAEQVEPLIGLSPVMKTLFIGLTIAGIGAMIWARIDDRRKGLR